MRMSKNNKPPLDPSPPFPEPRKKTGPFFLNPQPPRRLMIPQPVEEPALSVHDIVEATRVEIEAKCHEHGRKGGEESGKTRLTTAKEKWRDHALDLALEILLTEQDILPQEKLAMEIARLWRWEEPCRKSMLVRVIREWGRQGKLPRRRK
jgi:hypothetical protein